MKIMKYSAAILISALLASQAFTLSASAAEKQIVLDGKISTEQSKTLDLSWGNSDKEGRYDYQMFRKAGDGEWESRSVWNEKDTIDVLNVYPAQPYLETWMTTTISDTEEPAGMGMFNIDSVYIDTFNAAPTEYMLDGEGNWKYDVIFFGSSNCNSYKDLSAAAYPYVQQFADSGRGILFGHDTICTNFGHYNFAKFADPLGIKVKNDETSNSTTSVSVVNIGTLTNFPWEIRGTLNIPSCHSYGQFVGGTLTGKEWMTLNTTQLIDEETGAHSNFYLVTKGNLGMIQTGHSNSSATDDERKVLANTLFYLYQISPITEAKDNSFYDEAAPEKADIKLRSIENGKAIAEINAADNGTDYQYYISASNYATNEETESNIITKTALSGIKGYVYGVSDSAEPIENLVTYDENNEVVQNVITAGKDGKLSASIDIPDNEKEYYLHVVAVDNENNVGEEYALLIDEKNITIETTVTTTTTSAATSDSQTSSETAAAAIEATPDTGKSTAGLIGVFVCAFGMAFVLKNGKRKDK